ncbi:MAG TPA: DinB family protein [Gemmatimonadales bacterium]|nr:DinB family protein [Gemmatimonadales bacterium]
MTADAFAAIPDVVLGPLAGRPEADWHRAPPGKWTSAQIVHHLAISLETSGRTFEQRRGKPPMRRRARTPRERFSYFLVLQVGWMPSGRRAPELTHPAERPDPLTVGRQLREGVARFLALERELLPARGDDLFVKNPALGDLTLPEWLRFHVRHCAHHARQIRARLGS